ncbi:MAG: hypothetical protein ABL958_09650 [Bdellovibrionia bacterium]
MKFLFTALTILFAFGHAQAAPKAVQVSGGALFTCTLFDNQKIKCWGDGYYGQTGLGTTTVKGDNSGEMGDLLPYVDLGTNVLADRIYSSEYTTCARTTSKGLKCWGYGYNGSLAHGTTTTIGNGPNQMGDLNKGPMLGQVQGVLEMDGGYLFFCAIFEDKRVKCWGDNSNGQLGYGDTLNRGNTSTTIGDSLPYVDLGSVSKPMKISGGRYHTCALFENGKVKCWGSNSRGELGLGDNVPRGNKPGQMGDALPFVNLGTDMVTDITAGEYMSCALFKNGKVKCWGDGQGGRLGYGDTTTRGTKPTDMGDNLAWLSLGDSVPIMKLQANVSTTCARFLNGTIKCWGNNGTGQLGYGDRLPRGDDAAEMGESLEPVYLGRNARVESFSVSANHTCATVYSMNQYKGTKCWGYNYYGQLGLEHRNEMGSNAGDMNGLSFIDLGQQ